MEREQKEGEKRGEGVDSDTFVRQFSFMTRNKREEREERGEKPRREGLEGRRGEREARFEEGRRW